MLLCNYICLSSTEIISGAKTYHTFAYHITYKGPWGYSSVYKYPTCIWVFSVATVTEHLHCAISLEQTILCTSGYACTESAIIKNMMKTSRLKGICMKYSEASLAFSATAQIRLIVRPNFSGPIRLSCTKQLIRRCLIRHEIVAQCRFDQARSKGFLWTEFGSEAVRNKDHEGIWIGFGYSMRPGDS